jgi:hypothetical protein
MCVVARLKFNRRKLGRVFPDDRYPETAGLGLVALLESPLHAKVTTTTTIFWSAL